MSTTLATDAPMEQLARRAAPGIFTPVRWLHQAWRVLLAAPLVSTALGLAFTALGAAVYAAANALPLFTVTFATLLLAVSPFLAAAAYAAAMQVTQGYRPTLASCARSVAGRALSIGIFATLCGLLMAAWVRLAGLIFALHYGVLGLSSAEVYRVWEGDASPGVLVLTGAVTVALAGVLFTVAVIALPRLVDRDCDVVRAVMTGLRTIRSNPLPFIGWLLVLPVMIGLALVSQLVLMPLVFPILAYAAWFGYVELARG